ncbi:rRNA adenine N-6-methyltransferase family protein [Streptomyces sp. NPDC092296]|uniref:rRNA adenine N-6-methyltransferase family protein n=1 Tax=Streptomyces sp. NPDC092296 TaxID=3366012 RepID=UPI0038222A96
MTATVPAAHWAARARRLADMLRAGGALHSEAVADAFAAVPRHAFISGHYLGGGPGRTVLDPEHPDGELLALAYADRGIMTHTPADEAGGYSSASQPAVVARMLEAAQLTEGTRVLEIGAGTGYNAALISRLTRTPVTTVEASPVVAAEARAALRRTGHSEQRVRVVTGDGYAGHAGGGPWDRIIVTCGIAGLSPHWLDQLAPHGSVIAPLAHAGVHPLARISGHGDGVVGRLVTMADFMNATGPLYAGARTSPSTRSRLFPAPATRLPGTVPAALDPRGSYSDLWMYLAAQDPRITCASAEGPIDHTGCALVTEDETTAVFVRPGGLYLTEDTPSTRALAEVVAHRVAAWDREGRPALDRWTCRLTLAGDPESPIQVPGAWALDPEPAAGREGRSRV